MRIIIFGILWIEIGFAERWRLWSSYIFNGRRLPASAMRQHHHHLRGRAPLSLSFWYSKIFHYRFCTPSHDVIVGSWRCNEENQVDRMKFCNPNSDIRDDDTQTAIPNSSWTLWLFRGLAVPALVPVPVPVCSYSTSGARPQPLCDGIYQAADNYLPTTMLEILKMFYYALPRLFSVDLRYRFVSRMTILQFTCS